MFKKLFISILLSVYLFFAVGTPYVSAQVSPWYLQDYKEWYLKVYDTSVSPQNEIFGERYTAAQVTWVIYGLIAFLMNVDKNVQNFTCILNMGNFDTCINQTPLFSYNSPRPEDNRSVLAVLFPADRQFSGVSYVRSKLANFHVIPRAQAQAGFGFTALGPIQGAWRAFRDIMYAFFVIVIIAFAFMIMFRMKISPQTVVTVQSAIPKVVITLILVTFSYAIAGFLIDLAYVVIGLLALMVQTSGFFQSTPWSHLFDLLTLGPGAGNNYTGVIGWIWGYWAPFKRALLHAAWGSEGLIPGAGLIAYLIALFLVVGIIIWLIITVFKIFILLIRTYISILVSVIFAPFIIGFGVLTPSGGFGSWIKGLITNLMVYPVVGGMFILSYMFLASTHGSVATSITNYLNVSGINPLFNQPAGTAHWYPPLTLGVQSAGSNWDPLPVLWLFGSLGILAMIPKVTDIIKALMSGKGIESAGLGNELIAGALGTGAGYALGAGRFVGGGALDTALTRYGPGVAGSRTIEGWRATPRGGIVGAGQRFVGRSLSNLGERRGVRNVPSSSTGWYRRGDRPL